MLIGENGQLVHKPPEGYYRDERLSKTGINAMRLSPLHYQHWLKTRDSRHATPAMVLGAIVNDLLLDIPCRYSPVSAQVPGTEIVKDPVWSTAQHMVRRLQAIPEVTEALEAPGKSEAYITFEIEGIPCKALLDRLVFDGPYSLEVKTSHTIQPHSVKNKIVAMGYDIQIAWQRCAVRSLGKVDYASDFVLPWVESKGAYGADLFRLSDEWLAIAEQEILGALARIHRGEIGGIGPYMGCARELDMPLYKRYD